MGSFFQIMAPLLLAAALSAAEHRGVVSSKGIPIPGATVIAAHGDRRLVTSTDETGRYVLDLAPGEWRLEVSVFGFETASRAIAAGDPAAAALEWKLELKVAPPRSPAPARAAGFQNLAVIESAERDALDALRQRMQDPGAEAQDSSEAFLVQGSLSGGLANVNEPDFMEQRRAELMSILGERGLMTGETPFGEGAPAQAGPGAGGPGMGRGPMMGGGGGPGGMGRGGGGGLPPGAMERLAAARERFQKKGGPNVAAFGNRRPRQENGLRGMVNFSLRNSALDARPYSLTGQSIAKPSYAQSRFGFSLGGPLVIPKVLKLDRTMIFVNYFGTRSRNPFNQVSTMPGAVERLGDFSQSEATIYDPSTGLPFPGNRIPSSRIDPASAGLLAFFPSPNQPGTVQNYHILTSVPQNSDNLNLRLNQPVSRRDRISGAFGMQKRSGASTQLFGFRDESSGSGLNFNIGWNRSLSQRVNNQLRWTLNRNRSELVPFFAFGRDVAGELGIQGTSREPVNYGPPNLSFTNFGALTDGSPSLRRDQNSLVSENLTIARGKHSFGAGVEYRRTQLNSRTDQNARGSFSFTGLATSGFDSAGQPLALTGFDFADFLLGLPQSSSIRFGSANTYFRQTTLSVHFQDEWRARANFTLNVGLRYQYASPMREKYGRMANLDVAPGFTGVAVVTPDLSGPYSGAFPDGLIDPDRNNFAPRVGIAWKPWPKRQLQVRAGYGIFYDPSIYGRFATRLASQPPFANTATLSTSLAIPLSIANGFAAAPSASVTNTFAVDRGYRLSYVQTWNLAINKDLARGFILEAGYLASKGTRLDIQRSPNRAAPGSPLTAEQRRQIGNAVGFTYDSSEGNSIMHSGQLRLIRRFRRGISGNVAYTFSKSIDNASSIGGGGAVVAQNDLDLSAERGLSSFDQRHQLTLFYTLTSPTERTGRFGRGPLGALFRNWSLNGGVTARSGQPFTARVLGNLADSGGTGVVGSGRADATGASIGGGRFFNLAAFAIPPAGRFGNAGRNTIPGPALVSINASVGRSFRMGESRRFLELRMETANTTNHVSYTGLGTVINALDYGLPTSTAPMRTVSLSARYRF